MSEKTKPKVVAVVQARLGSKRLPDKVLKEILGKPMLWHLLNRLQFAEGLDDVVIATTHKEKDRPILDFAQDFGFQHYAGEEEDLLQRFHGAANQTNADVIVRITADCPLIDPRILDEGIDCYLRQRGEYEFVSIVKPTPTYPHGLDFEIFSFDLLERLFQNIKDPFRREWFTTEVYENASQYRLLCMQGAKDYSDIRLTVDHPEDFHLIQFVFEKLYRPNQCFHLDEILKLREAFPERFKINQQYQRDAQYFEILRK